MPYRPIPKRKPKYLTSLIPGEKKFLVRCVSPKLCGWKGTRAGLSRSAVCEEDCPECGRVVVAVEWRYDELG